MSRSRARPARHDVPGRLIVMPTYKDILRATTDLIDAVALNDVKAACEALMQGADATSGNHQSMRIAGYVGNLDMIRLLVSAGADLHVSSESVLSDACRSGNVQVARYVLSQGADVNVGDGIFIRDAVSGFDDHPAESFEIIRLLVERSDTSRENVLLMKTCTHQDGAEVLIRYFLEQGFPANDVPLACAIRDTMRIEADMYASLASSAPAARVRRTNL